MLLSLIIFRITGKPSEPETPPPVSARCAGDTAVRLMAHEVFSARRALPPAPEPGTVRLRPRGSACCTPISSSPSPGSPSAAGSPAARPRAGRGSTTSGTFSLLSFCVAIAAIGRQADLRPALLGYLFLAAACCGTCETGQPPRSAGQLRHGYHRTRRVRTEGTLSQSPACSAGTRPASCLGKGRRQRITPGDLRSPCAARLIPAFPGY